jgi:hypothetical protein
MNDAWGYGDGNPSQDETELNGPAALREAYKALKKQNEELNTMVTTFIQDQKKQNIAKVFETLGAPQAAELYQGEADPQKAAEWFNNMKSVFGGGANASDTAAAPGLAPEVEDQFQRMTQAGADGTPMGNIESANAAVGSATTPEDLIRIFQNGTFS